MDFKTELKKLNDLKTSPSATEKDRITQAEKVSEAFNNYSILITPKGKRPKKLSPKHFLSRYIPC